MPDFGSVPTDTCRGSPPLVNHKQAAQIWFLWSSCPEVENGLPCRLAFFRSKMPAVHQCLYGWSQAYFA